jgi:beta-glucosidase
MKNTNLLRQTGTMLMIAGLFFIFGCKPVYIDASKPVEDRITDLLSKMTLEEKISMIGGDTTGFDTKEIKRLGIPAIHITDGPLGVRYGKSTSFPAGTAMAATWDTLLMQEIGKAMGVETKAKGRDYLLGPCVCIQRFPFGGRNFETYSEDPYLGARLAVNWVKGVQSEKVLTSVKHFALNDQEWERDRYNVIADERTMREIHLPVFEAAVREGGAWSVMSAYNIVNGQHCSQNYHLLKDILKGDWGFKGFVVSDWVSVYSTEHAANAGLDLEMPLPVYFRLDSIMKAIKEGKVSEETINDKVRRLLRAAFSIGLFDEKRSADSSVFINNIHKDLVLKIGQEATVLLKNESSVLPLDLSKIKSIAVIGPNAKNCKTNGGGSSYIQALYSVSPLEGITKRVGDKIKITFAKGDTYDIPEFNPVKSDYFLTPDKKDKGLKAEYFKNMDLSGTPLIVRNENTINFEWGDNGPAKEIGLNNYSVRFSGFIKPDKTVNCEMYTCSDDGVKVFIDDKQVVNNWSDHGESYDRFEVSLKAGVEKKIVVEFYQHGGDSKLQLGWTYDLPPLKLKPVDEAVIAAKAADVAIIFAGLSSIQESEGNDPGKLELPGKQSEMIAAVAKANRNTIVVLNGGISLSVKPWLKDVKGLIDMFYLGQETGNAIASVIFGDVNPSGKMPFSFISSPEQSPALKEYKNPSLEIKYDEGIFVGYRYLDKNKIEPAFPFGFGLSYTTFEYSNMKVNDLGNNEFDVTADIKNIGKAAGDEIVQLYVSDKECSVPRPVKELKGFSRVNLNAGETKTVTMHLKGRDFAFWDVTSNNWKIEPGDFEILVAASSRDIKLKQVIVVK